MTVTIEITDKQLSDLENYMRKRILCIQTGIDSATLADEICRRVYVAATKEADK